jgi:23S rRNA pseudouridine1911/1915/1917 synthase
VALVCCRLETGRTHQLRVHLAELTRTPIFGDPLYGGIPADEPRRGIARALGRQALHAGLLGFVHPITGEQLQFSAPIPEDMRRAIEALRAIRR